MVLPGVAALRLAGPHGVKGVAHDHPAVLLAIVQVFWPEDLSATAASTEGLAEKLGRQGQSYILLIHHCTSAAPPLFPRNLCGTGTVRPLDRA